LNCFGAGAPSEFAGGSGENARIPTLPKDVVTADDVRAVPPGGELPASPGAVVTPWAREVAASRGVRIAQEPATQGAPLIAIGADHGGYALKEEVKSQLAALGLRFRDLGAFSADPVDYPDIALAVARAVKNGEATLGILIDAAGIGSSMAANKVPGVRAALCADAAAARNAREHNDANVLTLGAKFVDAQKALEIVQAFLAHRLTEERHARRVQKIKAIEESYLK
jgi:ribose 5-phosphate isomerase B